MTSKASPGNFFEDFSLDQTLSHTVPRTITEGDAALYIALTGDRNPLHCAREFAQSLGYKRELVNDLLVFHVVFGKSVPDISLNAVANLGYAGVRFLAPVYAGDTVRAESRVIGKKENSNGKTGNVYVYTRGFNQRDQTVIEFYRWVMIRKCDIETRSRTADFPDLPKEVLPDELHLDDALAFRNWRPELTGGRAFFYDFKRGEQLHHGAGMTVEEAEHAMATRLYHNTAKVHFDGHAFDRRIVYGGHVISIARALSFNGLENALRILAWNGGTHANPVYAGDTLYAVTEVLDTAELPGRDDTGALRLRLIATKNLDPAHETIEIKSHDAEKGREVYHPNVVLDLDYWVLMPKQWEG